MLQMLINYNDFTADQDVQDEYDNLHVPTNYIPIMPSTTVI